MFSNEPTNPKIIVSNILSLSETWTELLGPPEQAQKPKKRRAPAKRKAKSS